MPPRNSGASLDVQICITTSILDSTDAQLSDYVLHYEFKSGQIGREWLLSPKNSLKTAILADTIPRMSRWNADVVQIVRTAGWSF